MKFIKTGLCELIIAMILVGCAFDPKQKAEVELENSILELNNDILKEEIGQVFVKVLEDAGVYKYNEEGRKAFDRFIAVL